MSRAGPPEDFDSIVEARSSALFRTAVLLHHERDLAVGLLARAVATAREGRGRRGRAGPGEHSSPETQIRNLMMADFVASSRRRRASLEAPRDPQALADPLAGSTARARALLVLGAYHQLSPERSARVVGMSARRAVAERREALDLLGLSDISDLTEPLNEVAESYSPPAPATLHRAAAEHRPRLARRRGVLWIAAATVGAVVALSVAAQTGAPDAVSENVDEARVDPDYRGGYGLLDGRPQPFVDGLRLERTEVIDYRRRRTVVAAPEVGEDVQLYAVAYCDLPGNAMDVDAVVNAIALEVVPSVEESEVIDLSCQDRSSDLSSGPLVEPLPRGADEYAVTVPAVWSGTGSVHLALYSEADWSSYPFPSFEAAAAPPAVSGSDQVITAQTPPHRTDELAWLTDDTEASVHSLEVDVATALQLTTLTQEPGQLLVALDGVVVTNDGEEITALGEGSPGPWQQADPALRQGFWRGYAPSGDHQSLDSAALSALGVDITDDRVVVSVIPRGFTGAGWEVVVTSDAGLPPGEQATLAPGFATTLPEYAHGLERVGAYSVPTDGRPHQVPLPADEVDELTFIGACDITTPYSVRTVMLRSPTRYGLIPCAAYRNEWTAPLTPDTPGPPINDASEAPEVITLTAPDSDQRASLTIGVYRDVAFADFPFEATGQPSTDQLNLRPVPDEGELIGLGLVNAGTRWQQVDQIAGEDLDPEGRATLGVPPRAQALLSISTKGPGRLRVNTTGADRALLDGMFQDPTVLGRVASPLMYRDGWWTSWTAEPTQWTIPVPPGASDLEVEVQGYEAGGVELSVLVATSTEGTEGTAETSDGDPRGNETLEP